MSDLILVWFRRDLRLSDHTALNAALDRGAQVLPVFVFDPALNRGPNTSANRLAFLLAGLESLDKRLREYGSRLIVRRGEPASVLRGLVAETGAIAVYANRDYTLFSVGRDERVRVALSVPFRLFEDGLVHPPEAVTKADGSPYTVFTPFFRAWSVLPVPEPDRRRLRHENFALVGAIASDPIPSLVEFGFASPVTLPKAGEAAARRLLTDFTTARIAGYSAGRNDLSGPAWLDEGATTSALSPYLRFGMLSPRQALADARDALSHAETSEAQKGAQSWISELGWREFYAYILVHFPHVLKRNFKPQFDRFEWRASADELERWKAGMTGYPVVDAAMRQLAETGWMHNRARMIVASFLCKDLLHHWSEGESHFMQYLLDGDPASNNGGWQWTAGTGTDAQPFFRVFNPVLQSQRFDSDGAFIRRWVPELRNVSAEAIHAPWESAAPPPSYPSPMIDHYAARDRALVALKSVGERA